MFDIILAGGTVYDGSGESAYQADIAILGDRIAAIGDLAAAQAGERLDVSGYAVAPGFIDLHTHSDFTLLVNGKAESQVHQGVTTEVIGQCGFSCAPVRHKADIARLAIGYVAGREGEGWLSFAEYLERLEETPLGINVAAFVGHGTIHRAVMGDALRAPEPDDVDDMAKLVDEAMAQGASGLSTGLEYWPGIQAAPEHLVPLCAAAARHGGLYASHVRNRDFYYELGFSEALATARQAGARLQISHIQTKFGAPEHAMAHTMEMIDGAQRRGLDVAFDIVPHDWAHTLVMAILPQWAQEGGVGKVLERLADPALREEMKKNRRPMWQLVAAERWSDIMLLHSEQNPDLVGETFADIARQRNTDPYNAVFDLLLEEGEGMQRMLWTSHIFRDTDLELCLEHADCAVASDTMALAPYGALENQLGSLSGYGWAARFLQHFVRERCVLPLAAGIRRLTSLPAERLAIKDRGRLRPGLRADIAVFDADRVASRCTVTEPRLYPSGFEHVMVNGKLALRDGTRTDHDGGVVLRGRG